MTSDEKTAEKTAELKTVIREANEVLRDLRNATHNGKTVIGEIKIAAKNAFEQDLQQAVQDGIAHWNAALTKAIEGATQAVFARFDTISDLLLGSDRVSRRRGEKSLDDIARREVARRNGSTTDNPG